MSTIRHTAKAACICVISLLMIASSLIAAPGAYAVEWRQGSLEMDLTASGEDEGVLLRSTEIDGTQYFFLPSGVKEENMTPAFGEDQA